MKTHLSLPTRFEMEDFNEIEKFIHDYAKQNSDGFTISIILENDSIILQKTTRGKVAAYAETQDSFDLDGLKICLSHAHGFGKSGGSVLRRHICG